ncbi:hypothetical protein EV401DRAFT_1893779 [Pisolithus croceorrhizus]|nr:hypothetical protein EV401DRAFT_1893779 [Pisolithus croceorrhizus]
MSHSLPQKLQHKLDNWVKMVHACCFGYGLSRGHILKGPTLMISDTHRGQGMCPEVGQHILTKSNNGQRVADSHNRGSGEGVRFSSCTAPLYEPSPQISEIEKSQYKADNGGEGWSKTAEEGTKLIFVLKNHH